MSERVPLRERLPAVAWIDTHDGNPDANGTIIRCALTDSVSRPVAVGELVLLVDFNDGAGWPIATWGRVTHFGGTMGGLVFFAEAADPGRANGWLYVAGAFDRC